MEQRFKLNDGKVLIKTEESIYFLQSSEGQLPLLIDKKEGEKLIKSFITKKKNS